VSTPTQELCTLRDLDELGIAVEALSALPLRQKRNAIRAASGEVAAPLRKYHLLPLAPAVVDLDVSGLSLGAGAELAGAPAHVGDLVVKVIAGGSVGSPGITYKLSTEAGADVPRTLGGSALTTFGATTALGLDGVIAVDGVTLTLSGSLAAEDVVSWGAEVDAGIKGAVAEIAVDILTGNRGRDGETAADLTARHRYVISRVDLIAQGMAQLAPDADASPELDEGGPQGDGQDHPWDWQDALP